VAAIEYLVRIAQTPALVALVDPGHLLSAHLVGLIVSKLSDSAAVSERAGGHCGTMATGLDEWRDGTARLDHIELDIVVPVYNEKSRQAASIEQLAAFLDAGFPLRWRITIADNASTDSTWAISTALAARDHRVHALHPRQKGRGRALGRFGCRATCHGSPRARVGCAARNASSSRARISRSCARCCVLGVRDAQCGFKAIRADVARRVLPMVEDNTWFFDTELLVVAERAGLRIAEMPVDWVDDPDSRVDIMHTALGDLGRRAAHGADILVSPRTDPKSRGRSSRPFGWH
jgi:Glycosyl transferase family 2